MAGMVRGWMRGACGQSLALWGPKIGLAWGGKRRRWASQPALASDPVTDSLNLFRREGGKDEVRIGSLPGQGLGFVQREPQHAFVISESVAPLGEEDIFDFADLSQNFLARSEAQRA